MTTALVPVLPALPDGVRFKTVPVTDDGFDPELRCGDFAIIDTANREPEIGAFVFEKSVSPGCDYQGLVQLAHFPLPQGARILPLADGTVTTGPYWRTSYGMTSVYGFDEDSGGFIKNGRIPMGDGPVHDALMREMIVGRVVGVLRPLGQSSTNGRSA